MYKKQLTIDDTFRAILPEPRKLIRENELGYLDIMIFLYSYTIAL
jgi:hypothetical protein